MSPNVRKWLLIGGGSIAGLLMVLCLVFFLLVRPMGSPLPSAAGGGYAPLSPEEAQRQAIEQPSAGEIDAFGGGVANDVAAAPQFAAQATQGAGGGGGDQAQIQHLIVKNGTVTVNVTNTYEARNQIIGQVNQMAGDGAFVVSSQESGGGGDVSPYISMVIRVPVDRFDETMEFVSKMAAEGTTAQRSETADDVTNQYVDVKARVEALELAKTRLEQIMAESQNTNDLLIAEQQLAQREQEINALKGQMQYLEQTAALSSITVSLQPYILSQPVDTSWQPGETLRRAFDDLIDGLRGFADFLIYFAVAILPFLIIAGLIIYGVVRLVTSRVRRNRAMPDAMSEQDDQS